MAANVLSALNDIDAALRAISRPWNGLFSWAEDRTGISRLKLFFGVVCATCMFLIPGSLYSALVSDLLGFAYPAYATVALMMRTVEKLPAADHRSSVSPDNRWFTYWVLFAVALTVQQMCGGFLRYVPLIFLIKTAFFMWCAAPMEANGAAYVYAVVVRRYFNADKR
ncbi:unnamed protein product [Aphis gossypii]|uniref:Receptor expression-enhancing protein n=1 Tax=Aphis gossypii TaxID=80765 RepID=A0A9P0NT82_APHGO|nr:unnamed protein product [Aphis gossypii]